LWGFLLLAAVMYVLDAARIVNEEQASKAKWGGLFTDAQTTRDLLGVIAGSIIRMPKSVPGTGCDARSNASKQGARIGARHRVRRQGDASKQGARIGARHRVQRQGLPQMALN
jgi:hypothetical protein